MPCPADDASISPLAIPSALVSSPQMACPLATHCDKLQDGYTHLKETLPASNQKLSKVSLLDRSTFSHFQSVGLGLNITRPPQPQTTFVTSTPSMSSLRIRQRRLKFITPTTLTRPSCSTQHGIQLWPWLAEFLKNSSPSHAIFSFHN